MSEPTNQPEFEPVSKAFLETELIRQEHRLHRILINFFVHAKNWPNGDPRRAAATEAIFYRIAIAMLPGPATSGAGIAALIGLYFAWQANSLLDSQNSLLKAQTSLIEVQTEQVQIQTALTEATRRASLNFELANILQGINEQASAAKTDEQLTAIKLSNGLYGRIVALSRNLKPYRFLDDSGKLIERPLSPERGQLLIAIHTSGVDMSPIARDVDFTASDLERANLRGADLSDMVLSKSNLKGADLSKSSLRGTDLRDVDLTNASLKFSDLSMGSDDRSSYPGSLKGATLVGCDFYGAVFGYAPKELFLSGARLHGVILSSPRSDVPKHYQFHQLKVRESLKEYPPQIVVHAFEFVEAAKKYGEFEEMTLDPLANAKHFVGSAVILSDSRENSRTPIKNQKLLQSKIVPQPYWKLPLDLQAHFNQQLYYNHELSELSSTESAPVPDLALPPGPAPAPAPAAPSMIYNSREP